MKTTNTNTDSTIINSALILLAILFTMLSFQVKAQTNIYGCTDVDAINFQPTVIENGTCAYDKASLLLSAGHTTTAIVSAKTPSTTIFEYNMVVVKYKVKGTNGWTKLKLNMPMITNINSGTTDTLGIDFWYFNARNMVTNQSGVGFTLFSDGDRGRVYVRLNGLNANTIYKTKVFFKGNDIMTGANKTNTLTGEFQTGDMPLEAGFHPSYYN